MDAIQRFEGGFLLTNAYLLSTPGGGHLLIDAPADTAQWLTQNDIKPLALLLTHQHFDHVMDTAAIAAMGVPIYSWNAYSTQLTAEDIVKQWGMPMSVAPYSVDHELAGQEMLEIDGLKLELAHVPGHSPDSVTFHDRERNILISGDTLFNGSTGRGDLPGGDLQLLCQGIVEKIYSLPGETKVYPGHGPDTTVAAERVGNGVIRA
ncbi:MBL fold metallo-hydrolase [Haloferula chungangensis]|uniref:MBL fold metallo-hydrolase n=1 Tax=Haloferula chungangensis TaxID=1048331 RepID=A0ABW2L8R2_9BACT